MGYNPFAAPKDRVPAAQPQNGAPPVWSLLDDYLWHTCEIVADLVQGRAGQRPVVAGPAPLGPGERALAVGPAQRATWRALGNGTYTRNGTVAFGSPAFVLGSMAATALGNAARRNAAARDARPRGCDVRAQDMFDAMFSGCL